MTQPLLINGREYSSPKRPAIVICLDGCEPAYLDEALAVGAMPALQNIIARGTSQLCRAAMPTFTNPNNVSIATGVPPSVHGISGNFFLDPATSREVMMNDASYLRAPTIFSEFHKAGSKVAIVSAKDKLCALLGTGLSFDNGSAICFSAEKADTTTTEKNGIANASQWLKRAVPPVYSAELSEFVFAAGVKLLKERRPDLMYLTTTDYIQHKHAPGSPVANDFYAMFDRYLKELDETGATIVITADHGMKPKHLSDGSPAVVYIQDLLNKWLGTGVARTILPITDPYVVHHGALGSYAMVYLPEDVNQAEVIARLSQVPGIECVLQKEEAATRWHLPHDRIGDLIITSTANFAVGKSVDHHDLAGLDSPLRSHGGLETQTVPLIINDRVDFPTNRWYFSYDAWWMALQRTPSKCGIKEG